MRRFGRFRLIDEQNYGSTSPCCSGSNRGNRRDSSCNDAVLTGRHEVYESPVGQWDTSATCRNQSGLDSGQCSSSSRKINGMNDVSFRRGRWALDGKRRPIGNRRLGQMKPTPLHPLMIRTSAVSAPSTSAEPQQDSELGAGRPRLTHHGRAKRSVVTVAGAKVRDCLGRATRAPGTAGSAGPFLDLSGCCDHRENPGSSTGRVPEER